MPIERHVIPAHDAMQARLQLLLNLRSIEQGVEASPTPVI